VEAWRVPVDLRLLEAFVALGHELHFTRAAAQLGIAQPALSQQIRRLERQAGFQLFERGHGHVTLTAAGSEFWESACGALKDIQAGIDRARASAEGRPRRIRVAHLSSLGPQIVPAIIRSYAEHCPEVLVSFAVLSIDEQLNALRNGSVDLGIFRIPDFIHLDLGGLRFVPLALGHRYVVLPEHHPLACRSSVTLRDLASERWIMPAGAHRRNLVAGLQRAGIDPVVVHEVNSFEAMAGLVRAGIGITTSVRLLPPVGEDLVFVPIEGDDIQLVAAWSAPANVLTIREFAAVARRTIAALAADSFS
jgi:DNA-binding transcriptional LysR family regulator